MSKPLAFINLAANRPAEIPVARISREVLQHDSYQAGELTLMIVTTIRIQTTPENRKELMQTFRSLSAPIENEHGCKSCRVYREVGNEETVIVIQEWDSRNHWDEHLHSEEFAVMMGAMSLLQEPEAIEFQVLGQLEGSRSVDAIKARSFE